jgi:hypothetical protein
MCGGEDTVSGVTAAGMRAIGYAADSDETALRTPVPSYSTRLRSYQRCWGSRLEPRERLTSQSATHNAGVVPVPFCRPNGGCPLRGTLS